MFFMSLNHKTKTSFGSDDGQGIDTGYFSDPSNTLGLEAVDRGSSSAPKGLFVIGDAGTGSAGSFKFISGGLAAPAPTTVTTTGSALTIEITWDTSVASAPSAFMTGVIAAAQAIEASFNNAVTINLDVGYGEIAGTSMGSGALGESESYLQLVGYASLRAALVAHNSDATTAAVLASLPSNQPVNGNIWVTTAQAKALGLASANGIGLDGYIGLGSAYAFTYGTGGSVAAGTYDFNAVVSHEITEVMGRMMLTGGTIGSYTNSYDLLDLLHYSAPGVRDFSAATPGYFSANGGVTNGGTFNTVSGGDAADWASSMGNNAFDAFSNSGVVNPVTSGDIAELNAIGWTLNGSSTPPPVVSPPSAIGIAPITTSLAAAQRTSGLNANSPLATLTATGGVAGDTIAYKLGGTSAGSFKLTANANKTATLSVGATSATGGTNGKVYALTLQATDTTTGLSNAASAFDIVVGGSGGDTVSIATLVGAASKAAPTFIYGLAGNDTLNGSGMTGKLWFDGGAGADIMIGGSGANTFLYAATSDSNWSAMDSLYSFSTNKDFIDLTGIGSTHLNFVGYLSSTNLAANSIGYQTSGSNTFVYVNTSSGSESLSATNMLIGLSGLQTLGANNILHN
jgi:hypothetical protein